MQEGLCWYQLHMGKEFEEDHRHGGGCSHLPQLERRVENLDQQRQGNGEEDNEDKAGRIPKPRGAIQRPYGRSQNLGGCRAA